VSDQTCVIAIDAGTTGVRSRAVFADDHSADAPDLGPALDASDDAPVQMSLAQSLVAAAQHNLDVQLARVIPEIRQDQLIEAEAEFDWAVFGQAAFTHTDQPIPASALNGVAVGSDATIRDQAELEAGFRKRIQQLGGTISLSTGADQVNDMSPRLEFTPDPAWTANVAFEISQPLLRDFGAEVNGARIRLAENARDRDVLALRQQLLRIAGDTEAAYWELAFAHIRLAIQQQLLDVTRDTRDEVVNRRDVDANPVQLAQAESELRTRQSEVSLSGSSLCVM